ncbi:unnamed protein product [Moneuplotes crassus]|uniref:Protein kinase domain-containing protein n=1 Tax=Euplotes crassus TaxID=5936 RepID=A0AAD1X7P4_EUPCR|nr:unnamed protein product [Moneuplotes crassus]
MESTQQTSSKPKWDWRHWKQFLKKNCIINETSSANPVLNGEISCEADMKDETKKDPYEELKGGFEGEDKRIPMIFTDKLIQDRQYEPSVVNEFNVVGELGKGAFSVVYLAEKEVNGEKQQYALKQMSIEQLKKDKITVYTIDKEQEILTSLQKVYMESYQMAKISKFNHPNVIKIFEIIEDDSKDTIYLVIEFCHFGQISDWNRSSDKYIRNQALIDHLVETEFEGEDFKNEHEKIEKVGKFIFKKVLEGLKYLHDNNYVHRDIKPDNIWFSKEGNNPKIGDFTVTQYIPSHDFMLMSKVGTPLFMAPEMEPPEVDDGLDLDNIDFDNLGDDSGDDSEDPTEQKHEFLPLPTDIWSMGVTIFSYFGENCPFNGDVEYQILQSAQNDELPRLDDYSEELNQLLAAMCHKTPTERPSVQEVLDHAWFTT